MTEDPAEQMLLDEDDSPGGGQFSDAELRMFALQQAASTYGKGVGAQGVVTEAAVFLAFLRGESENTPETPPAGQ